MSTVKGKIKQIFETVSMSEKFSKRDLVLTSNEKYPQDILIQFTQDKCFVLDKYSVGQDVEVNYNLKGREWVSPSGEVKYFNTIEGWKIEANSGTIVNAEKQEQPQQPQNDESDLPF